MPAGRPPGKPPKLSPEEQRARQAQAKRRCGLKRRLVKMARANARNARIRAIAQRLAKHELLQDGLTAATQVSIERPRLKWLDQHGRLHIEKELSAEQLIARWQRAQAKKNL